MVNIYFYPSELNLANAQQLLFIQSRFFYSYINTQTSRCIFITRERGSKHRNNSAQAIWQVGKDNGVYLKLLNDNGTVKDLRYTKGYERAETNTLLLVGVEGDYMKELLEKLSSYNIFNYLLPGVVFVVLADAFTTFRFVQQDIILGVFMYYFIGVVISRIGSVVIEPILKWSRFIYYTPYADFISASKEDESLKVFSEANNMYRTFCSLFVLLILLKIFERLSIIFPIIRQRAAEFLILGLLTLFLFSYRKQSQYIKKRIQGIKKGD